MDLICRDIMMQSNVVGFQPSGLGFIAEMKLGGSSSTRIALSYDIELDSSNNIYIAGYINDGSNAYGYLGKLNNTGTVQWQKQVSTSSYAIEFYRLTYDGTDIYVGGTRSGWAVWMKFSTSGSISWQTASVGGGQVRGLKYNSYSGGRLKTTTSDYPILRFYDLNMSGSLAYSWSEKEFDDTTLSGSHFLDNLGGFATRPGGPDPTYNAVAYYEYHGGVSKPVLFSIRDDGADNWKKEIVSSGNSGIYRACTFGFDYTGSTAPSIFAGGYFASKAFLVKYSNNGTLQWQRDLSGGYYSNWSSLACDSSSNVYAVGKNNYNSSSDEEVLIAKYNSSGTLQWQRTIRHSQYKMQGTNIRHSGSTLYITGYLRESNNYYSMMIYKLPDDGSLTGTYGNYTYAASSLTASTPSYTSQNNGVDVTSGSLGTGGTSFQSSSPTVSQTFTAL